MSQVFTDASRSTGGTPLVRLNRLAGSKATVLAKIEGRNPAYSIKDRIGAAMIEDAEQRGALTAGMEIIEPTSGNTGIALAFVAAAKGYAITLTMQGSQHDLGIACHFDTAGTRRQVGQCDTPNFDVVFRRDADFGVGFDALIASPEFGSRLHEGRLVVFGLMLGWLIGA